MLVEWHDSPPICEKGASDAPCRSNDQKKYEERLKQMRESKDKKTRQKGEELTRTYERLQGSKAVFEVTNSHNSGDNAGEITYQGNNHFSISLVGNDPYGLTDNQRLAHEFEHGRQVLDGELSFANYTGKWLPWEHDRTDEAEGFAAGFDMERASPGQGAFVNSVQQSIDISGVAGGVTRLGRGDSSYHSLEQGPNNVDFQSPAIYRAPQ